LWTYEECIQITDVNERKQLIRKYGRCFICLKKGHISKNCSSNVNCNACGKQHHRSVREGTGVPIDHVQYNHPILGSESRVALQTAQALVKGVKGGPRIRVLFDTGS
jgi:hypothetical protein